MSARLFPFLFLFCAAGMSGQTPAARPQAPPLDYIPATGWEDALLERAAAGSLPELDAPSLLAPPGARLDINAADAEQLRALGLLTEPQINALIAYRAWAGPLLSRYELQAVPFFDTSSVRALWPWIRIGGEGDRLRAPPRKWLAESRRLLRLRWGRHLELARGFRPRSGGTPPYLGSPDQLQIRFQAQYSDRLWAGWVVDKDRGEPLWGPAGGKGFDHLGFHFFARRPTGKVRALALGDYRVSLGQGLLAFGGFGYGKGAAAVAVQRAGPVLRPHRSAAESGFLRGLAATLDFGPRLELTLFASRRRRDGNRVESDSLGPAVSALQLSGLHRTEAERADRKALRQQTYGGSLRWRFRRGQVALNGIHDRLSLPLRPSPRPDNIFAFRGARLSGSSLDYRLLLGPLHLFGEAALSLPGSLALLQGMQLGLGPRLDLALLLRHYPPSYASLRAAPFGETSGARNETGLYLGLTLRPAHGWTLEASYDRWRHPWKRLRVDMPSTGWEARIRLAYRRRRRLDAYLEYRGKVREQNGDAADSPLPPVGAQRRWQVRLHLQPTLSAGLSLRLRLDLGADRSPEGTWVRGTCLLQDILYRPVGKKWGLTARYALFHTGGYAARFYHYENGLLGLFAIPAYYGQGSRWYLNLRYRPWPGITLEGRLARSYYRDRDSVGSGYDEIEGPRRTELAAQLQYVF